MGTVAYMSPEQASGKPLDARSDIFSFGVVLYEMLGGHRPFRAPSNLELLQLIVNRAPEPLPEDIPATLRMVVNKALQKNPADRYPSMSEMVVDLRRLMRQSGEKTDPGSLDASASLFPAPKSGSSKSLSRPRLTAAVVIALVVVAGGIWLYQRSERPALGAGRCHPQNRQARRRVHALGRVSIDADGCACAPGRSPDPTDGAIRDRYCFDQLLGSRSKR